jgi:uncharacterized membrane protein
MTRAEPAARRREAGQIAVLILLDVLVCVALLAVVVSAGAVHLTRHRLQAVADAAALDAADALDAARFYGDGAGPAVAPVPLTGDTVLAGVTSYLEAAGAYGRFPGLTTASPTGTPDGTTAEVTLVATAPLPLAGPLLSAWSDGVEVRVTGRARATAVP